MSTIYFLRVFWKYFQTTPLYPPSLVSFLRYRGGFIPCLQSHPPPTTMRISSCMGLFVALTRAGAQEQTLRMLVPFYVKPLKPDTPPGDLWTELEVLSDNAYYDAMEIAGSSGVGITVVINPANGPFDPTDTSEWTSTLYPLYRERVPTLINKGIEEVLCYVPTGYGERTDVETNIDMYAIEGYFTDPVDGTLLCDGIFLDETSADAAEVSKYDGYYSHAQTKFPGGKVVFNTGLTPNDTALYSPGGSKVVITSLENYFITLPDSATGGGKVMPAAPASGTSSAQHSAMIHGAPSNMTLDDMVSLMESAYLNNWGSIFLTDDLASTTSVTGELIHLNPWDTVPSFLSTLLEAILMVSGSVPTDPCATNPCLNNGTCNEDGTCTCVDPYFGDTCNELVDPCATNPCLNNGTCNEDGTCTCVDPYFGDTCNELVDYTCIPLGEMTCEHNCDCCRDSSTKKDIKCGKRGNCCVRAEKSCEKDSECCGKMTCEEWKCKRPDYKYMDGRRDGGGGRHG
ncbi:unnamed protein product [Choristocarpus tenellus]